MRTLLFITQSHSSVALAKRIEESGNRVLFEAHLFEGNLFNPEVFKRLVKESPELVVMDSNFEAAHQAKLEFEKMGIPVYGSSLFTKSALNNQTYIEKILNINGIKTRDISENAVSLTYSVILNGKEKICSCLFFEYEHLMNENKGPHAYMGSVGYFGDISLIEEKMLPMIQSLIKSGFIGMINFQLKLEKDIWCSGVHFYFSWNTIYNMLENVNMNPADLLYGLSLSQNLSVKFRDKWSCQINCAVPPFPYELCKDTSTEIKGIDSNNNKHVWVMDFKSGELLCATGRGKFVREAKRRAYRTLSNITVNDIMYRTDIGSDTVDNCRKLRDMDWLEIEENELVEAYRKEKV